MAYTNKLIKVTNRWKGVCVWCLSLNAYNQRHHLLDLGHKTKGRTTAGRSFSITRESNHAKQLWLLCLCPVLDILYLTLFFSFGERTTAELIIKKNFSMVRSSGMFGCGTNALIKSRFGQTCGLTSSTWAFHPPKWRKKKKTEKKNWLGNNVLVRIDWAQWHMKSLPHSRSLITIPAHLSQGWTSQDGPHKKVQDFKHHLSKKLWSQ